MFKKLSVILLSILLLTGCNTVKEIATSKNDFKKETTAYIDLSMEGKYDEAEEYAALSMSNPFKDEAKYIKDTLENIKDLKKCISTEKYEDLVKRLDEATAKIVTTYEIDKSETDDYGSTTVKVKATLLKEEILYDNLNEVLRDLSDKVSDYVDDNLDTDKDYAVLKEEAYKFVYNDKALDKILEAATNSYKEGVIKFVFDTESGKIQYVAFE